MGQRAKILTEIFGFAGWRVQEAFFEWRDGTRADVPPPLEMRMSARLVLVAKRKWAARCGDCGAICGRVHERLPVRRWADLPWGNHPVEIEAAPIRTKCRRCRGAPVELLPWAESYQRQTRRLQQHLALKAASMPVMHVAIMHGLSWGTVRRAEGAALARWDASRPAVPLRQVGVDEKWLGRRHKRDEKFVTIVSNLETGEPVWIGLGRDKAVLQGWLASLSTEQKAEIRLFAMDMHGPYKAAVREDPDVGHVPVVHDSFHVIKRAGEAISEIRKDTFFRAGVLMRGIGRGTRWLVLRAWERSTEEQRERLKYIFSFNAQLARAYQIVEELRVVLRAPDQRSIQLGLHHILLRTQRRRNVHLRKLHDSLRNHWHEIVALGEHRPATGRIEALNNNWETLVRRARGYRDLDYLLLKLKFMTATPLRTERGVQRFLALGLPLPMPKAA